MKKRKITPERITELAPNEVFVFGSNYAGRHGRGAALLAKRKFGARTGQGAGMMGQSYGIATKDRRLGVLPLVKIQAQVNRFLRYAEARPALTFMVTQIGCGLAGYKPKHIAPFFKDAPANVALPLSFVRSRGLGLELSNEVVEVDDGCRTDTSDTD